MPLPQFIGRTVIGSGARNALFVWLGYVLGRRWDVVRRYTDHATRAILAIALVGLAVAAWRRLRAHRAAGADR